jgi:linoleate 10R-lipoxygenase
MRRHFPQVSNVLFTDAALQKWRGSFSRMTSSLIKEKSVTHVGSTAKYVDIVKDVINLVPVHWIANEIVCVLFVNAIIFLLMVY